MNSKNKSICDDPSSRDLALINIAETAMLEAYAKYSDFQVGAAVISNDDAVYAGFNIENLSFGLTNCAERTALFHALASGESPRDFKAIAIIAHTPDPICPCGACLQVMMELGGPDLTVIMSNADKSKIRICKMSDMLPYAIMDINKIDKIQRVRKDNEHQTDHCEEVIDKPHESKTVRKASLTKMKR